MTFVQLGRSLELKYLLKYSCIIYNHELDDVIESMVSFLSSKGDIEVNKVLTITKGLSFETGKQKLVMDVYVQMNQPTKGNNKYMYLESYSITSCVYTKYKGHPQNASMATREVNEYIKKNELEAIGPVHQVMYIYKRSKKKQKKNEVILEVYVQVS